MSLKAFHIFFITVASAVCAGCAVWAFKTYASVDSRAWQLWFGIGGVILSVALMIYGRNFLKKTKNVSYL